MARSANVSLLAALFVMSAMAGQSAAAEPTVDLSAYNPACGITVHHADSDLRVAWPAEHGTGHLELNFRLGQALIRRMGKSAETGGLARASIENADPTTFLLVGSRQAPAGDPPNMSVFNVFFDAPATRP